MSRISAQAMARAVCAVQAMVVCFQAMKESGLTWVTVTEDEQERQMRRYAAIVESTSGRDKLLQPPAGVRLRRLGERSISPQDRTRLLLYFLGWDQLHGARVDLLCAPLGLSEPDPLEIGH